MCVLEFRSIAGVCVLVGYKLANIAVDERNRFGQKLRLMTCLCLVNVCYNDGASNPL